MRNSIITALHKSFGDVEVYLFGSRLDDTKKGGDIDIAIKSNVPSRGFKNKRIAMIANLERLNFAWKVDIVQYCDQMDALLKKEIDSNKVEIMQDFLPRSVVRYEVPPQ